MIIIPYVQQVRDTYGAKDSEGNPMRAFVYCDGEATQIEVFQERAIITLLCEALVDLVSLHTRLLLLSLVNLPAVALHIALHRCRHS